MEHDQNPQGDQIPEEPKPASLDEVVSTLNSLGGALQSIVERQNELDEKLSTVFDVAATPDEPVAPVTPDEPKKPQTWEEVMNLPKVAAEEAKKATREEVERIRKEEADAEASKVAEDQAHKQQLNDMWDTQLAQLEKANAIPKVADEKDENDAGRQARKELFGVAAKKGITDLNEAIEIVQLAHEAGKRWDTASGKFLKSEQPVPGANSPVGSSTNRSGGARSGLSHKDIHALSMDQLADRYVSS